MSDQLSEQKIAEYRETFNLFDKNGDNTIDIAELGQVMKALGQQVTNKELQEMIRDVDADNNGTIDFNEFLSILTKLSDTNDYENDLLDAFKVFDKDGNGNISKSELQQVMIQLGQNLSAAEIDEMIREADTNNDGMINYQEFARMMSSN